MFEPALRHLNETIENIKQDDLDAASSSASMMEAKLPLDSEAEEVNRVVSRYVTLVSQYCSEDYDQSEDFKERLLEASNSVEKLMRDEEDINLVEVKLKNLQERVRLVTEVERVDEDSAWGKMVQSMLEE